MISPLLIDPGPLVALLSERDRCHPWAKQAFARAVVPLHTCEAVRVAPMRRRDTEEINRGSLLSFMSNEPLHTKISV